MLSQSGLFSFLVLFLTAILSPFLTPALIVQAIRIRSASWTMAAGFAAAIWAIGIMVQLFTTSDPMAFAIVTQISVVAAAVGLAVALFAAWAHPVRRRERSGAG